MYITLPLKLTQSYILGGPFNSARCFAIHVLTEKLLKRKVNLVSQWLWFHKQLYCEFWGFCSGHTKISGLLECDAASLGKWFSMLQRSIVPSLSMAQGPFLHRPLTQRYCITSQKTRISSFLKTV